MSVNDHGPLSSTASLRLRYYTVVFGFLKLMSWVQVLVASLFLTLTLLSTLGILVSKGVYPAWLLVVFLLGLLLGLLLARLNPRKCAERLMEAGL